MVKAIVAGVQGEPSTAQEGNGNMENHVLTIPFIVDLASAVTPMRIPFNQAVIPN